MSPVRRRIATGGVSAFAGLWLLTALLGPGDLDRSFDQQFARGSIGLGSVDGSESSVPVLRIPFSPALRDPDALGPHVPQGPWRARTRGLALGPFLLTDDAAYLQHALAGASGRRIVFWFFGCTRAWWIRMDWVS